MAKELKVAIVHDWLTNPGGAERVVLELHKLFPKAPVYTSVYRPEALPDFAGVDVRTTWLQKLPLRYKHQLFAWLRPFVFRRLDLKQYDLVISSSSAEAKNVRVRDDAVHICYCHTPIRYYWSHYEEYMKDPGLGIFNLPARLLLPILVRGLRRLDYQAAQRVTHFVANSTTVADRIKRYYDRESTVIHPPVDVDRFGLRTKPTRAGLLVVGRQVPYKRIDLAVAACTEAELPLTVIGQGSEHETLRRLAGPTITFLRDVDDQQIVRYYHSAEALIFPSEEDFGITPVEGMAAGLPIIAYGVGGARDSVISGKTGLFFAEQTVASLRQTLENFKAGDFKPEDSIAQAATFSNEAFAKKFKVFTEQVSSTRTAVDQ